MSTVVRDAAAAFMRALPPIPGKARVSSVLQRVLVDGSDEQSLAWTRLHDRSRLLVDLRNPMQARAFWTGRYDAARLGRLSSFLTRGDTVVDVGAHIGFYTVPLASRLRALGGGTVWALEPLPANAARLRENVAANDLTATVNVLELAVGAEAREAALRLEPGAPTGNAAIVADASDGDVQIAVTRLDDAVRGEDLERCTLVKIDTEGSELDVLRGAPGLLRDRRPVLVLELNPYWMSERGWSLDDLRSLLTEHRYELYATRAPYEILRASPRELGDAFAIPLDSPLEERAHRTLRAAR